MKRLILALTIVSALIFTSTPAMAARYVVRERVFVNGAPAYYWQPAYRTQVRVYGYPGYYRYGYPRTTYYTNGYYYAPGTWVY